MTNENDISKRKEEHVRGALEFMKNPPRSPFDDYTIIHNALPEIDLSEVDATCEFLGKTISAPLIIDSITGGPSLARNINFNLAAAAQKTGVPLALGSAKIVFTHPETIESFDVRDICPDIPLLLNLGLVDLDHSFTIDDCRNLVKKLRADALIFHLNPLHEALQSEGNTNFRGLEQKLKTAVNQLAFPIIIKEVGHGISPEVFARLETCGVHAINIAGQSGTSWGYIEARRAADPTKKRIAENFTNWGIPTPLILEQLKGKKRTTKLIASGGIRTGIDIFKSLTLGADITSAAAPFLNPALESANSVEETLTQFILELRLAMFATGADKIKKINSGMLLKTGEGA